MILIEWQKIVIHFQNYGKMSSTPSPHPTHAHFYFECFISLVHCELDYNLFNNVYGHNLLPSYLQSLFLTSIESRSLLQNALWLLDRGRWPTEI